jgi:hypothetical protein
MRWFDGMMMPSTLSWPNAAFVEATAAAVLASSSPSKRFCIIPFAVV